LGGRDFHPWRHLGKNPRRVARLRSPKNTYKDVPESKLLSRDGNDFKYYRLRVLKNGPINSVFRAEFDAHYHPVDPARWVCQTRTKRGSPKSKIPASPSSASCRLAGAVAISGILGRLSFLIC
jgi:hypothetical protein